MSQNDILELLAKERATGNDEFFTPIVIANSLNAARSCTLNKLNQLANYGYLEIEQIKYKKWFSKGYTHFKKFRIKTIYINVFCQEQGLKGTYSNKYVKLM